MPDATPDQLAQTMTHWPPQANPAAPYLAMALKYLQSGDYAPVHLPGTQPADYLRELYDNPEILDKNIEQAGNFNFAGMAGKLRPAGYWQEGGAGLRAIHRLNDGRPLNEIADALGVSSAHITQVMKREGIERNFTADNAVRRIDTEGEAWLREMEARGISRAEMARMRGVSPAAITQKFERMRQRDPESSEGWGVTPKVSEWEATDVPGVMSRRIGSVEDDVRAAVNKLRR